MKFQPENTLWPFEITFQIRGSLEMLAAVSLVQTALVADGEVDRGVTYN